MIKAYLSIKELKDEEIVPMQELATSYGIEYQLLNIRNNRRFYVGIMRDESLIDDFITAIGGKNPKIIGVFGMDGLPYGKKYKLNEETQEYEITGSANYNFDETEFLDLMPDKHTFDEDGNIISTERPIEVSDVWGYLGWSACQF